MNFTSVGDLAIGLRMRQANSSLKGHLDRLTEEVTTGVQRDIGAAVSGDFGRLAGIERSLRMLDGYKVVATEAELFAGTLQSSIGRMADLSDGLGVSLLSAASTANPPQLATLGQTARQRFDSMIATLNVQVADRHLFSGAATDVPPLPAAEHILTALGGVIAGETTADGVEAAVSAWFSAPAGGGGFVDTYQGTQDPLASFRLNEEDAVSLAVTAVEPRLRGLVQGLALAALLDTGALAAQTTERAGLARAAGQSLLAAEADVIDLRAEVGSAEERIASALSRNASEAASLQIARAGLVAADPYASATALEAVQTQIETLYTLTARVSRLSFADYL